MKRKRFCRCQRSKARTDARAGGHKFGIGLQRDVNSAGFGGGKPILAVKFVTVLGWRMMTFSADLHPAGEDRAMGCKVRGVI
jgi:hypothetical protein